MAKQHLLDIDDYQQAMLIELDLGDDDRLVALSKNEPPKQKMTKAYNKHV